MKRYKVLIIVGGGIFGAIPAHLLGMLPTDQQTLDGIDVLSGCSIGGILAAAYSIGQQFGLIDTTFQKRAGECFTKRFNAKINPLACPTYKNESIDKVLEDMIGNFVIGNVKNFYPNLSLIIPALDLTRDKYLVFDNIRGKRNEVKLKDIAGYTSAAPSYYSGREFEGNCIVDGGLIEVAPLLTATTMIKKYHKIPFCLMDVLMLGTGKDIDEKPLTLKAYNNLGLLGIATDVLVPYATLGNEMATRYWGANMGYGYFNYYNPIITNGKLDDVSLIPSLIKETDKYREDFLKTWNEWLNK